MRVDCHYKRFFQEGEIMRMLSWTTCCRRGMMSCCWLLLGPLVIPRWHLIWDYSLLCFVCVCCVWVCLCAYHLIGTAKPPLSSSLKLRTPGKDRRAFGTCNRMNFSFTCLCQLSPLFLSLYLGLTRLLPLSLTSIVSCSVSNSTPGTCASGESKHKSNPHATPTALMKHSLKRTV